MRFTMSQADRVSCVVHKRDAFYETEQIVKVESFSEDDLRSIKDSFNFAGKRHGSKGPNDTPSLYFYFYNKKNRLTAAICLDYAFNPHAYAFYFDKNKKQKNYWLHGTTTFRIRQYVLTNEKLKQALIQCGAKTRDFAPNYAFMGANEH